MTYRQQYRYCQSNYRAHRGGPSQIPWSDSLRALVAGRGIADRTIGESLDCLARAAKWRRGGRYDLAMAWLHAARVQRAGGSPIQARHSYMQEITS